MERQEGYKYITGMFTFLVRETVDAGFRFPGGGTAIRTVGDCIGSLGLLAGGSPGCERMTDFCICQAYAVSGFGKSYLSRWNVSHSFGQKAITRFTQNTREKRYYEDKWLSHAGLSRQSLSDKFRDRSKHPLAAFIYPEYEEVTKKRMHNSEAGFYICQLSTLLWTPFSKACRSCIHEARCREITGRKYGELYRIRMEEYQKPRKEA